MPLHVNLYHEVQRQELARQRDPLRLAIMGLLVIAIGFVANYFVVLGKSHSIGVRYAGLEAEYSKLEPKAKVAKVRQNELSDEITASETMRRNVDSRFYWAPVLEQILKTVPRNVQVTHVGAASPDDGKGSNTLSISGISSAAEPRNEAENLRTALDARLGGHFKSVTSVFKMLDDSDQVVVLDGRRLATATFTIEFQLQSKDPVDTTPIVVVRKSKFASAQ